MAQHGQPKEQQKGAGAGWLGLRVHQLLGQAAFAWSTGEAGPSVNGPGAKPQLGHFPLPVFDHTAGQTHTEFKYQIYCEADFQKGLSG